MAHIPSSSEALLDARAQLNRTFELLGVVYASADYFADQFSSPSDLTAYKAALADALDSITDAAALP